MFLKLRSSRLRVTRITLAAGTPAPHSEGGCPPIRIRAAALRQSRWLFLVAAGLGVLPLSAAAPGGVRVLAVGDLMLGTNLRDVIARKGPEAPFRPFRKLLSGADLTLGNLETPLSGRGTPTAGKSASSVRRKLNYLFRAPVVAARGLRWAGFDAVSLANNHAMDYGPVALLDSISACRAQSVIPVGAGASLDRAFAPAFFRRRGLTLAVFGVSDILPLYSTAGKKRPGVAPARGAEFEARMPQQLRLARKAADFVLVMVHWGVEKQAEKTPKQQRLARRLVDWGADVVIGSHTHVLGPTETYRRGLIHYSLGNFVTRADSRRDTAIWEISLSKGATPRGRLIRLQWNGKPVKRAKPRAKPSASSPPAQRT